MLQNEEDDFRRLVRSLGGGPKPRPAYRERLRRQMLAAFRVTEGHERKQLAGIDLRRGQAGVPMFVRAAAVAAILVLAGFAAWMLLTTESAAASEVFADVLERIGRVRTVTYNVLFQGEDQSYQVGVMMAEPGRIRLNMPDGRAQIIDVFKRETLTLGARQKKAVRAGPRALGAREQYDPLEKLRTVPGASGEFVGQEKLDDRSANVFRVSHGFRSMKVWADPETNLPIRVEILEASKGDASGSSHTVVTIMSDFVWDEPIPDSLFSLRVPEGYVLESEYDATPSEADLTETLRRCAELADGAFPAGLDKKNLARLMISGLGERRAEPQKSVKVGSTERLTMVREFGGPIEQFRQIAGRALRFVQQQKAAGNDWHYNGRGVKLGAEGVPICWWRPQGLERYRVVYGDLSVREVSPNDLPDKPPARHKLERSEGIESRSMGRQ